MLVRLFERVCNQSPDRTALGFGGREITYRDLHSAVSRLSSSLACQGVGRGDPVAVMLPNSPHFVITYLALLRLGAVAVPIHAQCKAREIAYQTDDSECRFFIGWTNTAAESEKALSHSETPRTRVYLGDNPPADSLSLMNLISEGTEHNPATEIAESDLAAIVYTPGVSGKPRGVELTHGNFAANTGALLNLLRLRESDRYFGVLPFSSISGLTLAIHPALSSGGALWIHSRFHPGDALQALADDQLTFVAACPYMYSLMAHFPSAERYDLSRLRYAVSCDAPLSAQTARDFEERLKVRLFEGYGTTETCGLMTLNLFPALAPRGSVGQPISGYEVAILNKEGAETPSSQVGQIAVRGPAVACGYHNRPERFRQVKVRDWLLTGDHGYLDDDSNLFVTGHDTELIMRGGFPVYAREIEEVIEGLPHVHEVAVVGIPDPVYGEEIKVCVVLKEGAVISPNEIIEYVKERIAAYKCPKVIRFLKELPRSSGGKISRAELREEKP